MLETTTLDVSSLNGEYYIMIGGGVSDTGLGESGTISVSEIKLEY